MQRDRILKTIWRVLYPYLLYLTITIVVQAAMIIPECIRIIFQTDSTSYSQIYNQLMQLVYDKAMLLTLISGLMTIPVLYLFFYLDKKRAREMHMVVSYVPLSFYSYIYAALLGIFACLSLNNLIDLSGIVNFSPVYQELADKVFGGNQVITFLTSACMAPVLEELLFRGLIYKRLRFICKPAIAAVISSLAFGLTHGNLVQFVYAFLAGMLLAYVYEKYKNLWAPILFHFCANAVSILGADIIDGAYLIWVKIAMFVIETAALFLIYKIIDCKVNRQIKPIISE